MTDAVRLRSNVVMIRGDGDPRRDEDRRRAQASLPGEVATDTLSLTRMTASQLQECSLYAPCISCHRSLWRIARQGCEYDCAAMRRAAALQDVQQTYQAARRANARQLTAGSGDIDDGRGRVQPIPEWDPS
jgi:hypothetical protein